jgi:tRNA uridine 5-carboxymethylaminomethyl modification enzyme
MSDNKAKICVVGAGHAGVEAALASARMGIDTILFTMSLDAIANLPCNPSIGGTAKGHLVYEIDALGGQMGRSADLVTLQARTLNLGKGAAVHSKRIQADRMRYRSIMKGVLESTPNLRVIQAEITDIEVTGDEGERKISAVITNLAGFPTTQYSADTIVTYILDVGTTRFEMGYASAFAVFLFVLMLLTNSIITRLLSRFSTD